MYAMCNVAKPNNYNKPNICTLVPSGVPLMDDIQLP